jgi:hypothetical protein
MIGGTGAPGGILDQRGYGLMLVGRKRAPRPTTFDHVEIESIFLCSDTTPTRTRRPVLGYSCAAIAER